ncbi:uncharacterized protein LOC116348668 [Contarinia nasturtii]|uniref:uncharacterized protein LOC116348668 n=1 Tax=Contarinia nasturtii TaxID=265458 RepID=UPI0012D4259D|nr:uncharacterized protein LOC116348668 [Contarinia nasturtii]XP_031635598.1 uncharacterized protein LOC116348668 [Contarinia nasturtii]
MGHEQTKTQLSHPTPKIFKLNIDCFDEIFEYLDVKDLHSFGQTCKRMNKVAGEYFKQNYYSSCRIQCERDGIYMFYRDKSGVQKFIEISGFNKFVTKMSITNDNFEYNYRLKYLKSHINEFESIKYINLRRLGIDNKLFEHLRQLLPQLEVVQRDNCYMNGDIYDLIFKYCKNLREIHFQNSSVGIRTNGELNWLLQEYPKLQHFELTPRDSYQIEELRDFFVRNPNVQRFSTSVDFLWDNRDILLNSKAKLDILELEGISPYTLSRLYKRQTSENIVELLNRLHEQGFYKRLHIYSSHIDERICTSLASFKGLEFLYIRELDEIYYLAQLTNLRELMIWGGLRDPKDMEILANTLIKLERLYIDNCKCIDEFMPFIRRSPQLNRIKIIPPYGLIGEALNLAMLNKERAKLVGARKIIIYTRDDVFLATKWTTRNGDTNLRFIEMKRLDSIVWNHHF